MITAIGLCTGNTYTSIRLGENAQGANSDWGVSEISTDDGDYRIYFKDQKAVMWIRESYVIWELHE